MFARIAALWGRLDIMVHSIAWAPKEDLQGGLLDCSAEGFAKSVDISCHSFIRMARLAVPLMKEGGTMFAMSYHGAAKVVPNYNVMGPVKAALEASCRYLAYELGPRRIRVHAISPGPLNTRAAGGLKDFDLMLAQAAERAPLGVSAVRPCTSTLVCTSWPDATSSSGSDLGRALRTSADNPLVVGLPSPTDTREFVPLELGTDQGAVGLGLTFFGGALTPALKTAVDELACATWASVS